ncbi:hypothetical protein Nepgr_019407 [Nepenthes gracilis]|uniref:Myb/SANT-like DNA-binding domain-containing protein n=1 Tax=Nepenthes gracilis TaxID=150966 RepID=A0AAD3XVA4_NEPGR|nr:hypothetical protein Nepgr_019407 [Nepenthes gracilis]
MEDDEEIYSRLLPGSASPSSPQNNCRSTVTVASASAATAPPPQNSLSLALPIQQPRTRGALGGGGRGGGVGGGGREDCWSEGATSVLIDAWGERYLELSRGNMKQQHWKEVADIVNSREDYAKLPKTDIQCKNRIDTVKKKYKIEKAKIAASGGPSKWSFFDRIERLIGPTGKAPTAAPLPPSPGFNQKVLVGIPVGVSSLNHFQQNQQQSIKQQFAQPRNQNQRINSSKQQFRKRPPGDSESEPDEPSPDSTDSFLLDTNDRRKRPRMEFNYNTGNTKRGGNGCGSGGGGGRGGNGRVEKEWWESVRELTGAILNFGEAYEQAESSKLQQLVEMEKQRMKFAKELELQRMKFFVKTQLELSQLSRN